MRKLTMAIAGAAIVATGTGLTALAVGPPSTEAAPTSQAFSCGKFEGDGPVPDCVFRVLDRVVRVELRNNGTRPDPVVCTLGPVGAQQPTDSTTMGPGKRGFLSATSAVTGSRAYVVDCQSAVASGKEVSRRAVFTVTFAAPDRAPSTSKPFAGSVPTHRSLPKPVHPKSAPTITPTAPSRFLPFAPHAPGTTTTTTTTPVR